MQISEIKPGDRVKNVAVTEGVKREFNDLRARELTGSDLGQPFFRIA